MFSVSSPAFAALKVGDPAPKLRVAQWVQGDAVDAFEGDKVYIGGLMEMKLLLARRQSSGAIEFSKILSGDFAGQPEVLNAVAAMRVSCPDASPTVLAAAEKIVTPLGKSDGDGKSAAPATHARIAVLRDQKAASTE